MTPPVCSSRFAVSIGALCCWLVFCCWGCNTNQPDNASYETDKAAPQAASVMLQAEQTEVQPNGQDNAPTEVQRKMIYTANIRLRVKAVDSSHRRILAVVRHYGGYIASDNTSSAGGRGGYVRNEMTIRIAQKNFDAAFAAIEREAVYTEEKDVRADDVTKEFVDIEARLQSKRAAEEQYREILKRAGSIKDVLEVQKYLNDIREEIEAAQGRLQYLQNQVSYATINVVLYESDTNTDGPPEDTFIARISSAIVNGWDGLLSLIVGVLAIWPVWLIVAAIGWSGWKFATRERKKATANGVQTTDVPNEK